VITVIGNAVYDRFSLCVFSTECLITAVESYIRYYNTERIQRKLHLMTPAEFHDHFDAAA
ncbi:IS3 family transposase, partial [Lactiplantibacillus plantarum]|uniref:IS3 family transposase n=1 Tax=Lactiplantibacillus plantarum TaxID=1590 RepID=UPI003852D998